MTNFKVTSRQEGSITVTRLDGKKQIYTATSSSTATGNTYEKALENATRAGASHLIRTLYEEALKPAVGSKGNNPIYNTSVLMGSIQHSA